MKWIAAILFAAFPVLGQDLINADRPGIADGSTTVGRGVFQVELGGERDDDSGLHVLITPLLLRYGLSKDLELRVETSGYGRVLGFNESGWSPLSAGLKWHFVEEDPKTHRPSLGVIGRIFPKSGSGVFRSDTTRGDMRLAGDVTLSERWSLNPNAGATFGSGKISGLAALTVQYNLTAKANVFVDGGYADSSLLVDVGTAWVLGSNVQLDASVGWRAHGVSAPNMFWAAGISRRF